MGGNTERRKSHSAYKEGFVVEGTEFSFNFMVKIEGAVIGEEFDRDKEA